MFLFDLSYSISIEEIDTVEIDIPCQIDVVFWLHFYDNVRVKG